MYPIHTNFYTTSESEFNFLMGHLEALGYLWESGDLPTYFIERNDYWTVKEYSISYQGRILCHYYDRNEDYIKVSGIIASIKRPSIFKGSKNV